MTPLGVKWKAFWIRNRAKVFCAILALASYLLIWWINSLITITGRRDYEKIQKEYQQNKLEIEEYRKKKETQEKEFRRVVFNPTHKEIKEYIRLQLDGHSSWGISVARCESGFNPFAISKYGKFYGLFQFWPKTYEEWGGKNIFDWEEQVRVIARKLREVGLEAIRGSWPYCGR